MMRRVAGLVSLLVVSALLSGCSGGGDTATGDDGDGFALAEGKGAVSGLLIDDIYRPIAGGLVLLKEAGLTATTDDLGQFSFLDVLPGSYIVVATAANHEATPQNVDVVAGEYAEVEVLARRIFSAGGHTITTQYSVFAPCMTTTPAITAVYGQCMPDSSGDTYRPGLQDMSFNETAGITYLVAEIKINNKDNYEFVLRHDDGSSLGGDEWGSARTNGTDYARVVLQKDANYQTWQGNRNWTNDGAKPMAAILFYLGTGGQEAEDAACGVPDSPACLPYFGVGQKFAVKANIIITVFIGEPAEGVDIATYHVMSPSP